MPDTIKKLDALKMPYNVSVLGVMAAMTALGDPQHIVNERARNTEVREFTLKALHDLGVRTTEAQANFVFADIGRPAKEFREACAKHGVLVGRDFPPFEKTHCRISLGTMEEMRRATDVFRIVLRPSTTASSSAAKGGR
jgi:histidinol-phosphate aminotransferase